MHGVVRRYTYSGQGMADLVRDKGEQLRQTMTSVPGVQAYYMILGDSDLVTVTLCDDQAGAQASNQAAAAWVKANMPSSIQLSAPQATQGEVAIGG